MARLQCRSRQEGQRYPQDHPSLARRVHVGRPLCRREMNCGPASTSEMRKKVQLDFDDRFASFIRSQTVISLGLNFFHKFASAKHLKGSCPMAEISLFWQEGRGYPRWVHVLRPLCTARPSPPQRPLLRPISTRTLDPRRQTACASEPQSGMSWEPGSTWD